MCTHGVHAVPTMVHVHVVPPGQTGHGVQQQGPHAEPTHDPRVHKGGWHDCQHVGDGLKRAAHLARAKCPHKIMFCWIKPLNTLTSAETITCLQAACTLFCPCCELIRRRILNFPTRTLFVWQPCCCGPHSELLNTTRSMATSPMLLLGMLGKGAARCGIGLTLPAAGIPPPPRSLPLSMRHAAQQAECGGLLARWQQQRAGYSQSTETLRRMVNQGPGGAPGGAAFGPGACMDRGDAPYKDTGDALA